MNEKYTHKKLEELLPEYLFGNMSEDEKRNFESSASEFPDIQSEINSVKDTLAKFSEFDLKSNIKQESRNLSVKVQEELAKKKKTTHLLGTFPKYVYPTIGLVAIIYIFFFTDTFDENNNEVADFKIFNQSDLALVDLDQNDIIPELIESNLLYNDPLIDSELISVGSIENIDLENFNFNSNLYNNNINTLIEELDEDEFIELLEDMKNEKIGV